LRTLDTVGQNFTSSKSFKGWSPKGSRELLEFRNHVDSRLLMTDGGVTSLHSLEDIIQQSAMSVDHVTTSCSKGDGGRCPPALVEAENMRRNARTAEDKKRWRTIAQSERRKWNASRALNMRARKPRYVPNQLNCDGILTPDRSVWPEEVLATCKERYTVCEGGLAEHEVGKLRASSQDLGAGGRCRWDMSVTLAARTKLRKQTSAGGASLIVPEMILAMSWLQLELINDLFMSRFLGDLQGEPPSWRHLVVTFLAKVAKAKELVNFRGICLSDVFAKWYVQGLMILVRNE
jgi:hypothetical protein